MTQQNLSSADLLTLQVLERELIEPSISKGYERELRARIEYLNATPTERAEMRYGIDPHKEFPPYVILSSQ